MKSFLFRQKKEGTFKGKCESSHSELPKVLNAFDLIAMGIGTIMGTGIFVFTGIQAAQYSGPAVTISLLLAALAAIFIALVYTEVASALPSCGGSYSYVYKAFGEVPGFMTGWTYLLYSSCAIPAIAAGWGDILSEYSNNLT